MRASREAQLWALKAREDESAAIVARARKRDVDELVRRKGVRLAELESQRNVRPKPLQLVGCAIVLPASFLRPGDGERDEVDQEARKASELRGMRAVIAIEMWLGHVPEDVSRQNVGWDVESRVTNPEDGTEDLLFIESKGVREDADSVRLSPNEVLKAAGNRDQFVLAITRPHGDADETTYITGAIGEGDINAKLDGYDFKIKRLVDAATTVATYETRDGSCTRRS